VGVANRFSESVALASALKDRDHEIRALQELKVQLRGLLAPSRTYPTALLGGQEIVMRRVLPDRGLGAVAGAVLGLAIGLVALRLWRRRVA